MMAMGKQIQRIYALGAKCGLLDRSRGADDDLHLWIKQLSLKDHIPKAAINTELRPYEVQIGVSSGTFTFDSQKGLVTATQVLSEDKTTYNTVAQLQRQLRPVLEALAKITITLARFYGIECEDGEPAIEFGDSVFEDTVTEFNRRFQLVQAGLLKPEEFNAWYFGVPIEKAKEMLPEMTMAFGSDD